jgi:hypothetical protein
MLTRRMDRWMLFCLGLLSASLIGTTAVAYKDYSDLYGGIDLPGCKEPCEDDSVTVNECSDPCNRVTPGGRACLPAEFATYVDAKGVTQTTPCHKNFCAINTLWWFECKKGNPGSGEIKCEYKVDGTKNGRFVSHREIADAGVCATTGPNKDIWHKCKKLNIRNRTTGVDSLKAGWSTPCWVGACAGVERIRSPYPGRGLCD